MKNLFLYTVETSNYFILLLQLPHCFLVDISYILQICLLFFSTIKGI
nr:MAG TPA: hypothetical protein [Caudoviricetes sp.]